MSFGLLRTKAGAAHPKSFIKFVIPIFIGLMAILVGQSTVAPPANASIFGTIYNAPVMAFGGGNYQGTQSCPAGQVIVGVTFNQNPMSWGFKCSALNANFEVPALSSTLRATANYVFCPDGKAAVGFKMFNSGGNRLGISCKTPPLVDDTEVLTQFVANQAATKFITRTTQNISLQSMCRAGDVVVAVYLYANLWFDQLGAQCAPFSKFTVTYNLNSGGGTAPASQTQTGPGQQLTVSSAYSGTRTGFQFDGWNTLANGLGTDYATGSNIRPVGATTLYAKWKSTITYDGNTNTSGAVPNSTTAVSSAAITYLAPNDGSSASPSVPLAKTGFTFAGWNTLANGAGTSYPASNTGAVTETPYMLFDAANFNDTTNAWEDTSGNSRSIPGTVVSVSAGNIRGNPSKVTNVAGTNGASKEFPAVQGATTDGIVIGNGALTNYTFCHVARYAGTSKNRIFAGITGNWLSGFWGSATGVAYHEGWITASTGVNDTNWKIQCDTGGSRSSLRSNGTLKSSIANNATGLPANISINSQGSRNAPSEVTDWAVAEFIIYDSVLSESKIQEIEARLNRKYGVGLFTSTIDTYNYASTGDKTLYAQWNSTITYNGNGQTTASSTVPAPTIAKGTAANTTLANAGTMARTNYTFAGWNTQADGLGTNYASGLTTYASTGSTTLYAKWTATITFNPNGASGTPATSSSDSTSKTSQVFTNTISAIPLGDLPTVGTMVRPGYTFIGWNTAANGSGTRLSGTSSSNPFLRYVASDYDTSTVTWANSGSAGSAFNISGTNIVQTNTGITKITSSSQGGSNASFTVLKGDTSAKITFPNSAMSNYTLCHVARYAGAAKQRIFTDLTTNWVSGYLTGLTGYYYGSGNSGAVDQGSGDTNWHLICDYNGNFRNNGKTAAPAGRTSLPANIGVATWSNQQTDWEIAEVLFYSHALSTFQIEALEASLKTTYGLSSLFTDPSTPATAGSYLATGNVTLYAQWVANSYAITYDTTNTTDGAMAQTFTTAGSAVSLRLNVFTRTGYTFKNWNTAANGSGTTYTNGQSVTLFDNLTLYPQWNLRAPGIPTVLTDSGNTEVTVTPTPAAASGTTVGPTTSMLVTAYPDGGNSFTPSTVSRRALASNVATLTTSTAHNLRVGERVIIAGVATAFNGTYTVASVPSSTTFTYATSGQADVVSVTSTGSATLSRTCSVVSPATSCVITGLTNGTTYYFAATATNATGTSASSTKVSGLPTGVAVTYNTSTNSGIIGTSGSTTTSSATFNKGTSLTLPVASRTGYEFSGWYNVATAGTLVGGPGGSYSPNLTASITSRSLTSNVVTLTTSSPHGFVVGMTVSVININSTFNGSYTITSVPTTTTFTYAKTATNVTSASVTPSGRATVTALTVYAQFVGITYTILYNGNGNTGGTVPSTGSVQNGGTAHVISGATNPPTKTGYTFAGWYTTSTGTGGTSYAVGASYSTAANLNLFAKWTAASRTVTYALDGGTSTATTTQLTGKVVGDTVTLPASNTMSKTGYSFAGWSDGTNTFAGGATWTVPASDSNFTLTALWNTQTLTYSYDTNGGGTAPDGGTKTYGQTLVLAASTGLSKTGYTFAGWNDGSTTSNAGASVSITTNKIFVAQWSAQSFSITYDGNGSTSGSVTAGSYVAGGVPYAIAANGFTRAGYNFAGWHTTAGGTGGTDYVAGAGYSTAVNLVLYAKWTPASYTITYNGNGSTGGTIPSAGTLTTGIAFNADSNSGSLIKTGYTFAGWNTAANGTGTAIATSGVVTTTANLTLYAQWTIISPLITFDKGIATTANLPSNTSAQYGSLFTLPATDTATVISSVNYIFTGWKSGNATYAVGDKYRMSESNVTFTAQWVALYDVTYVYGDGLTVDAKDEECVTASLCINNQSITTRAAPSRTGYNFTHWRDQSGTTVSGNAAYTVTDGHYVLYAIWAPIERTLSFGLDSGSGTAPTDITGKIIGEIVTLPTTSSTKAGYTFGGWSTGGVTYPAGGTITIGTANIPFTAVWVGNTNTITYNANGATSGTAPSNGTHVTGGSTHTIASNSGTLAKTGFSFVGWNTAANGSGEDKAENATGFTTTSDITLYAKWSAASYTVTYVTGVGASAAPSPSNTMYGSSFNLPTAPTRTGFNFIGWEVGSAGNATLIAPGASYTMGSSAVTFTAKWSGLSYVVVYQLNGGAGSAPTQADVSHGESFTTAAAATRNGFTFSGWSDGATLINPSTSVTNVTANKTLTAQWTIALPGIPGAPTAVPGDGSATITVVSPSSGGTPASYTITASPGGATCQVISPATSCTISSLTNGTSYTFTASASNTTGNSASNSSASAGVIPAGIPSAPTGVTASGTGGSATITWSTPDSNGGSAITDYVVQYSVAGSGSWTTLADGVSTSTSANVTGLTAGNSYEFRISAKNVIGTSIPSFTSPVASTFPTVPTISGVTSASEQVTVTWNAPSHLGSGTITGDEYVVTAYDASGNEAGSCKPTSGQTTCVVTGLDNGSSYTFKVAVITTVGTSEQSVASATAIPAGVPSAPANVTAVTSGSNMTITFDAPADNGGSAITSYLITSSPPGATCSVGANATTYTCTGLTAGTNYTYSVKAVNSKGQSSASLDSTAVTAIAAPSAPQNVSAVIEAGTTTLSATVSFDAPTTDTVSYTHLTLPTNREV